MIFDSLRNKAVPHARSSCPNCNTPLIAKCGSIMIWHWAHETLEHCDDWWEPISEWHLAWQEKVLEECREVRVGHHIADIKLSSGRVVEIQHSSLSVEIMQEREEFYGDMVWIFDGRPFLKSLLINEKISKKGNHYCTFHWRRPRHYIIQCTRQVFIDLGDRVLEVKEFQSREKEWQGRAYTSWNGWGFFHAKDENLFITKLFDRDFIG